MSGTTSPSAFRGFSLKETAVIHKQIVTRGAGVLCPRCRGMLTLGNAGASWELRCEPCQRKLNVLRHNLPVDPMTSP